MAKKIGKSAKKSGHALTTTELILGPWFSAVSQEQQKEIEERRASQRIQAVAVGSWVRNFAPAP